MADYVKASSNNLPKIDIFMIQEFLSNDSRFNATEMRGVKHARSTRECYGDQAIGYVCLKRQGDLCSVKGKVCPEHRINSKSYNVFLVVDEKKDSVVQLKCEDCVASLGGCKHAYAFLMWMNRRSEEPSPTEVLCYWKKPFLSRITAHQFVTGKQMAPKQKKTVPKFVVPNKSLLLNEIKKEYQENSSTISLLRQYMTTEPEIGIKNLCMFNLALMYNNSQSDKTQDFEVFAAMNMSEKLCNSAFNLTKNQADNELWHELRFGRVTASIIYEASRCQTLNGSLLNKILGTTKQINSVAMKRGRDLEPLVIETAEKQLNVKINRCGLALDSMYPMFGASPDGMGSDFIVEVKCPSKEKTIDYYIKKDQIADKVKNQMYLQMLLNNKKKGLLCVALPQFEESKDVIYKWLNLNMEEFSPVLNSAKLFWSNNVKTKLMEITK